MNIRFFLLLLFVVFLGIFGFFSWTTYGYYQAIHSDDPIVPYLQVISGSAKIIRGDIAIELDSGESYDLLTEDAIETGKESFANILWPDKSITRLGSESRIVIQKMLASQDYNHIEISYALTKGKVWNSVIRLMVGDSYFHVELPKEKVVAGVRGTTFEINLEDHYIHAVKHATRLTDTRGRTLDIFPGEIVSSDDISIMKGVEWLDTQWQNWNTAADQSFDALRALDIENRIVLLSGNGPFQFADPVFVSILGRFEGFETLTIAHNLADGTIENIKDIDKALLLEYYQKISGTDTLDYRDSVRTLILESIEKNNETNPLKVLLENASIWESIDAGNVLPGMENILKKNRVIPTSTLDTIRNSLDPKVLGDSLSGTLRSLIR